LNRNRKQNLPSVPNQLSFAMVKKIGLALPGVEEGAAYGSPALKVRGDLLACIAVNKSAEPNSLALRCSFEERDALIAEDPTTYYVTDHYLNYPCVLVRMSRVNEDAVRDLLRMSWNFVSTKVRTQRGRSRSASR
jgi:hypothetical protein